MLYKDDSVLLYGIDVTDASLLTIQNLCILHDVDHNGGYYDLDKNMIVLLEIRTDREWCKCV